MKRSTLYSIIGFLSGTVFLLTLPSGMAISYSPVTVNPSIVVQLDKENYNRGDVMFVSGEVRAIQSQTPLTIQIIDPARNLIHVEQIEVASDGRFALPIQIEGQMWRIPGNYTLMVQYGFKHVSAIANFHFEETEIPTAGYFNVKDIPSGQNFNLNYTITGGMVKRMYLEPQNLALAVEIDTKDSGTLHLSIPRLLLDAKKSTNEDESFLVYVDGNEITSFHEVKVDDNNRVLDVPISTGDAEIEIIGTTMIPEFPFALLALVITISSIIVISRTNHKLQL